MATLFLAVAARADEPGLVARDGVLLKDGKPYRAIGANYFSLFARVLKDPADTSSLDQLGALSKAGVPFVRFECCGFWPVDWKLYLDNRPEYFRRLDLVVRKAEAANVGLIPSLFWYFPTVSDLVGEPLDQMGNPASKTNAFIRQYTEEVVGRYKDSPAIWGWELGNEYNLDCNLPNAATHRPPVVPDLGTPRERSKRDEMKWEQLRVAMLTFAETARRLDPKHIILTGHSIPRASAWHNWKENKWTADTRDQFTEILLRDNPDPFDTLTVHTYYDKSGRYPGPSDSIDGMIAASVAAAAKARKPLFIGEFGAERQSDAATERAIFDEFLRAIEKHRVPLAAFWVFDQPDMDKSWNVTFTNDRAWVLEAVRAANKRMQ
ncbi:MAG: cellulase family glycosylhydrolase [Tepidisphaerales bacterium]